MKETTVEEALAEERKRGPVHSPEDTLVGETLANCWIVAKLGEGGFGAVYRAIDQTLHRPVALKVLKPERAGSEEVIKKFLRGCIAAAQLEHENIVTIYRVGRDDKRKVHYLVMEHVRGRTLQAILEDEGVFDAEKAIPLLLQAAEGLRVAHEKHIVHRDIKPDNLMLSNDGVVKVTDLGLARILNKEQKTTRVMGTPNFMSPEQFEGKGIDHRTDIYAFGVMLYYLVSGKFPYEGKTSMQIVFSILTHPPRTLMEVRPGVDPDLWPLVQKMIERSKEHRFSDMGQVITALRGYMAAKHPGVAI